MNRTNPTEPSPLRVPHRLTALAQRLTPHSLLALVARVALAAQSSYSTSP